MNNENPNFDKPLTVDMPKRYRIRNDKCVYLSDEMLAILDRQPGDEIEMSIQIIAGKRQLIISKPMDDSSLNSNVGVVS